MPAAWMISDDVLQTQLQKYLDFIATGDNWQIDLYKNDHVPVPGDTELDYTVADFDGYESTSIATGSFESVSVTDHVAISTSVDFVTFEVANESDPQTVYGYFVTNVDTELVIAERFPEPIVANPNDQIKITPVLRHTSLPY